MRSISFEPQVGPRFEDIVTVKRIVAVASMLMIMSLVALGASTAQGASIRGWGSSYEAAVSQSNSLKKPLVVLIAKEGCPACAQMEAELSRSSSSRALMNAIKVRVESSENPELTARYAAGGTPTTVVFAPGNYNSPVYTYTGAMDSDTIRQVGNGLNSLGRR